MQESSETQLHKAIVITGCIGSGKSTVVSLLRMHGFSCICADTIAHQVLESKKELIFSTFGKDLELPNGSVDRKKLGEIVFNDKNKKKHLESILHSNIREIILNQAAKLEKGNSFYFLDIPLFFEVGGKSAYPARQVLVIATSREIALNRITKRDSISLEQARLKLDSQLDIKTKCDLADVVIYNDGSLKELQENLDNYLKDLK